MSQSVFFIDLDDDYALKQKKKEAEMNGQTKTTDDSFYQYDSEDESDDEKPNKTSIKMTKSPREASQRVSPNANAKLNKGFMNE